MKIGELQECCESCSLSEYCTEPSESPQICAVEDLYGMDENEYITMAKSVTDEEIQEKMRQYDENNVGFTDDYLGAICDVILEKLYSKGEYDV